MTRVCSVLLTLLLTAVPAGADVLVSPYLGRNIGGSTIDSRTVYGASLTWRFGMGLGLEADVSTIPDFFEPNALREFDVFGGNNVTTAMGSLVFGRTKGLIQPYAVAGMGLLRQKPVDFGDFVSVTENAFGVNAGAGVRVGSRRLAGFGDARYLRSLSEPRDVLQFDLSGFSFFRVVVGVSAGF